MPIQLHCISAVIMLQFALVLFSHVIDLVLDFNWSFFLNINYEWCVFPYWFCFLVPYWNMPKDYEQAASERFSLLKKQRG